jgi:hypothetical protein
MRNLTVILTILNAIVLLDYLAVTGHIDGSILLECFGSVLLAGGGVYGIGKLSDDKTRRFEINSDPAPAPVTNIGTASQVNANPNP